MSKVVHFEIHADDVARAKDFYARVFGWTYEDYGAFVGGEYWGITTGPEDDYGIHGGLLQRPVPVAAGGSNAYVCTIGVADFDATAQAILDAGGQVALPKMALTGMAWQGYFLDTEGNTFGVHQPDPEAR
jgi:predicted enzyme related to lactoylglutathione lyase